MEVSGDLRGDLTGGQLRQTSQHTSDKPKAHSKPSLIKHLTNYHANKCNTPVLSLLALFTGTKAQKLTLNMGQQREVVPQAPYSHLANYSVYKY